MRDTDVSIQRAETDFRAITLAHPLTLSGGAVTEISLALVSLTVINRAGAVATGRGASILSVPWSWPTSRLPAQQRDSALRELTSQLARERVDAEPTDPIAGWSELIGVLDPIRAKVSARIAADEPIPHLAATLAVGAVDNALHDAWARAAGRSAYTMYDGAFLDADLAGPLGPDFAGHYPGEYLSPPRRDLPVQHVVSPTDPLLPHEPAAAGRPLTEWLARENLRHLKIKLMGRDPAADADRVVAIYAVARRHGNAGPFLSLDPNEAYASSAAVVEFLDAIRCRDQGAADAITYIEQPVPRGATLAAAGPGSPALRIPVLIDEGLTELSNLHTLTDSGWSGVVIKASKGQTFALLAHSYARAHGLHLTMQDLTATDLALRHSARLASVLACTSPQFEYNSRQYAPRANDQLRATDPRLVTVEDGHVAIEPPTTPGIY